MLVPVEKISGTAMAKSSDVVFSMAMNWLPVGGMITFSAWGSTMRRRALALVMPSARAASRWPGSTESRPERMISVI